MTDLLPPIIIDGAYYHVVLQRHGVVEPARNATVGHLAEVLRALTVEQRRDVIKAGAIKFSDFPECEEETDGEETEPLL